MLWFKFPILQNGECSGGQGPTPTLLGFSVLLQSGLCCHCQDLGSGWGLPLAPGTCSLQQARNSRKERLPPLQELSSIND